MGRRSSDNDYQLYWNDTTRVYAATDVSSNDNAAKQGGLVGYGWRYPMIGLKNEWENPGFRSLVHMSKSRSK